MKRKVYYLNLNKFGKFVALLSAFGMTMYMWIVILLGLAGM